MQVRNRWNELSADEHQKITQLAYQHMKDGRFQQPSAWPVATETVHASLLVCIKVSLT